MPMLSKAKTAQSNRNRARFVGSREQRLWHTPPALAPSRGTLRARCWGLDDFGGRCVLRVSLLTGFWLCPPSFSLLVSSLPGTAFSLRSAWPPCTAPRIGAPSGHCKAPLPYMFCSGSASGCASCCSTCPSCATRRGRSVPGRQKQRQDGEGRVALAAPCHGHAATRAGSAGTCCSEEPAPFVPQQGEMCGFCHGGVSRRSERGGSLPAVRGRIDSPGPPHAHTADGQRGRAAGRRESGSSILCLSPGAFPLPV